MKLPEFSPLRWAIILAALLVVLMAVSDGYRRDTLIIAVSFAICAAATDYGSGFAGMRTLGPIIPFGFGAYAHAICLERGLGFWISALAVPPVAATIGAILCLALAKDRRDVAPWAVFGLAASIALEQVARASTWATGGSNGILVPRYFGGAIFGLAFGFLAAAALLAALAWILWQLRGRRRAAILLAHFEPERLQTHGVSLGRTRVTVVGLQWGLSAAAGLIFASVAGTVDPSIFGIENNLTILVACTLFGERSIIGPAVAAFLIIIIENAFGSIWSGWQTMMLGVALVLVLIWRNRGAAIRSPKAAGP